MSKTDQSPRKDRRARSDLDLFILLCVERQINTPYALLTQAGLSPGATIPALKSLVAAGYLAPGKAGPRRRAEHGITTHGNRYLKSGWRSLLEHPAKADMDAVLRTATLAKFLGAKKESEVSFLREAARLRTDEAKRLSSDAVDAYAAKVDPAAMYARMRAVYLSRRLRCEAEVLRRLAAILK